MQGIARLKGAVKHYDWGGFSFIPAMLRLANTEHKPFAEFWMGIHPLGIGQIQWPDNREEPLTQYAPDLPYLLKVLDVKDMLSIQVHPSRSAAQIEFERENNAGIPADSPKRNYKDPNHKPEMLVALSDFYLLHGFKPARQLRDCLSAVPELRFLLPVFGEGNYAELYRTVMSLPQEEVEQHLRPLIERIVPAYKAGQLSRDKEDFWAARAAITFSPDGQLDRGIFSIYLFNVVYLRKGESLFQGAGLPHAYLEGQNVELMSNSDNVLRGGLTTKHIDVRELLKHVKCEPTIPAVLRGQPISAQVERFDPPVEDFRMTLTRVKPGESVSARAGSTEILLVVEGEVELQAGVSIRLHPGEPAAVALAGTSYSIRGIAGETVVYAASANFSQP